ncbi:MAG: hypothetical protein QOD92_3037 [Acidimicrobiaceae bacterium]|jgi:hypothetical protein
MTPHATSRNARVWRRRRSAPSWLILVVAYSLFGITWLATTPPWASPDEPSSLALGLSTAHGHVLGRTPDYGYEASTFLEQWYRQLTRTVDLPARQYPPALIPCFAFDAGLDASCLEDEPLAPFDLPPEQLAGRDPALAQGVDIRLLIARLGVEGTTSAPRSVPISYNGTYQPFVYGAAAVLAVPATTPTRALFLARLANLLGSLVLLATGIRLLGRTAGPVRWLGAALALTPMALFSAATFSSSGPEIAAAFCHLVALLEWFREGRLSRPVRRGLLLSGVVLAAARSIGPAWLLAFDGTALVSIGLRSIRAQLTSVRRWALTYVAAVGVAMSASLAWQVFVQPRPRQASGRLGSFIRTAFYDMGDQVREQIGVFGWLDTWLPDAAYVVWSLLALLLIVAGMACAGTKARALLAAIAFTSVAAMIGVAVLIAYPVESGSQGRWTLPVVMALPLVAAILIDRRVPNPNPWGRRACVGGVTAIAAVHVLSLWTAARRYAVGVNGDQWFLGNSKWHPPLGWAPWIATALVAAALMAWASCAAPVAAVQTEQPDRGL